MVWATDGSSTLIGWNRRSSAASFSRCLRYSSSVVAPIVWQLTAASIGFRMDAASIAPSGTGTHERCSSSMNKMMSPRADLLQHLLQALFEIAAVTGAGDEGTEVEVTAACR